jgi:hypothetical protein
VFPLFVRGGKVNAGIPFPPSPPSSSQIGMNSPHSIYEVGKSSMGVFWLGQEMER